MDTKRARANTLQLLLIDRGTRGHASLLDRARPHSAVVEGSVKIKGNGATSPDSHDGTHDSLMAVMGKRKILGLLKREWASQGQPASAKPATAKSNSIANRLSVSLSISDVFTSLQRQPAAPPSDHDSGALPESPTDIFRPTSPTPKNSSMTHARQISHPITSSNAQLQKVFCDKLFKIGLHESLFSDICIILLGTMYNLHRLVLVANPFFERKIAESSQSFLSHHTLEIPVLDPNVSNEAIQMILRRLYGDFTDQVTYDNLLSTLATAYVFQDDDLVNICHAFILRIEYSPNNSLAYLEYASRYHYGNPSNDLLRNTLTYLCREGVSNRKLRTKTFVKMDFAWFNRLVQSDLLFVASEFERFQFVVAVLKGRFPNFGEYTSSVLGLNTNVLSLGKLAYLPGGGKRASARISGASFATSSAANNRQSTYSETSAEGDSPYFGHSKAAMYRHSTFSEFSLDSPRGHRSSVFAETSGLVLTADGSPRLKRASMVPDIAYESPPTSPARVSKHASQFYESPVSTSPRWNHQTQFGHVNLAYESPNLANYHTVRHRSLVVENANTVAAYQSYQAQKLVKEHSKSSDSRIRRKSMLDPPTRDQFFAQHNATLVELGLSPVRPPTDSTRAEHFAAEFAIPEMNRGASLPALKTKGSRKSALIRTFQDTNAIAHNGAAVVENSVAAVVDDSITLVSKGILYMHMTPEELLTVREEKLVPSFIYDRHFRLQHDLETRIRAAQPSQKNLHGKSPNAIMNLDDPNHGFMQLLMGQEFAHESEDLPPMRIGAEFTGPVVRGFLSKSGEKLYSEVAHFAGSLWYLKAENLRGNDLVLSIGRKLSPHTPYMDQRPAVNVWCRMVCYVSGSSAVTDSYTFQTKNATVAVNGSAAVTTGGDSRCLFKEMKGYLDASAHVNLKVAIVFGLL
ncbi:hypothetical protein HDU80_009362 [Chytriomyces hyalinus]|nr:hypothetical protein HDU80_009362 [Chytriomyces hyalinus]